MKNTIQIALNEIKILMKDRFMRLSFFAIALIPLLYGALYLWAFWDPYKNISDLPVAVVNEDKGANKQAKDYNFGSEIADKLKADPVLKWDFVSKDQADKGLTDKKYYLELIIPEDFSQNIITADGPDPEPGVIQFKSRQATSMIAYQITNRVSYEISEKVGHEFSKNYIDNILLQKENGISGLKEAATGANQLASGLTDAKNGSGELATGSTKAYQGSEALVEAVNKVLLGSNNLNTGISQSYSGAKNLSDGISQSAAGAASLANGANNLQSGIGEAKTGVNQLIGNMSSTASALATAKNMLATPNDTINDANSPYNGMTNLQAANAIISNIISISTSTSSQQQIASLQAGLNQLESGSATIKDGTSNLSNALNNQIKPGSDQLTSGLSQLATGSNTLNTGINSLSQANKDMSSGLKTLSEGSNALNTGISQAQSGAQTLSSELSKGIPVEVNSDLNSEKMSEVMSDPVKLSDKSIDVVENYGTGFAPYFLPLALWVGALLFFQVFKVNETSFKKKARRTQVIFSKYLTCLAVSTIQAVVLDTVLILALGLSPDHMFLFYLFTIAISWSFASILQFFVSLFGDVGKFIGIVLLMLQLTSAAGTYPIETAPKFFQAINHYLPMTYAVSGLREIISGGNYHFIIISVILLVVFGLIFLLATLLLNRKVYLVDESNILNTNELDHAVKIA